MVWFGAIGDTVVILDLITNDVIWAEDYINRTWPKLTTRKEVPLKELFEEPENRGLKHIWQYGSADLVISKDGNVIAVIEIGGNHHFQDPKQIKNDKRKYKLCNINNVKCVHFANGTLQRISGRSRHRILGKIIFG